MWAERDGLEEELLVSTENHFQTGIKHALSYFFHKEKETSVYGKEYETILATKPCRTSRASECSPNVPNVETSFVVLFRVSVCVSSESTDTNVSYL